MSDNCHGQSLLLFIQHILLIFHMLNVYFEKNAAAYKFFDICNKVVCSQQVYSKREECRCKSILISSCSFSLRAPVTFRYLREPKKNVFQEKRTSFKQSCSRFFRCCLICMARKIMLNRGIAAILHFFSSQSQRFPFKNVVMQCYPALHC